MRKIRFIRHGKAVAAGEGQKDIDRVLGEVGIHQAKTRWQKMNGTDFGLVISSPAPRAWGTGEIVTSRTKRDMVIVDSLYPAPDDGAVGQRLDALFNMKHLGYAPVSAYLKEVDGACVTEWAETAWKDCAEKIGTDGKPAFITVFGHAVCLPALGMQLCTADDLLDFKALIANINLGECEGYALTVENGRVTGLELIRD